jgi:integrase
MARGHLTKRSETSWTIVLDLEPDPETNKRRQKWVTVKGTRRQAEAEMAKLLVGAQSGLVGNAGKMTVGQYLDRWLVEHAATHLASKTYASYELRVRRHLKPIIGRVLLEKLRAEHILALKTRMRTLPRADRREGTISASTAKTAYRILHSALRTAVRWRLIPVNPAAEMGAPVATSPEMTAWTAEQASGFLTVADRPGLSWQAFFATALNTGMRRGELMGCTGRTSIWRRGSSRSGRPSPTCRRRASSSSRQRPPPAGASSRSARSLSRS